MLDDFDGDIAAKVAAIKSYDADEEGAAPTFKEAVKFDNGKPPIGMIPRSALEAEARVLAYGAQKYARDNWRKGFEWTRLIDAALRHLIAFNDGEDFDPETGELHLAHAKCALSFLIEHYYQGLGNDDRHNSIKK